MNNIILIGMPGVGKSTVGVVLAKNMGYKFIDSDLVIQEKTNKLLHEIISDEGIEGFIKIENDINSNINCSKSVIATGGSAVYGREAMEHFKSIGKIVYLKLGYTGIKNRLGDLEERGVALEKGKTLLDLYKERIPLYEKYADIVIDCKKNSIRNIVEEIKLALK